MEKNLFDHDLHTNNSACQGLTGQNHKCNDTDDGCLMSSFLMKSRAMSEIPLKPSLSNPQSHLCTFCSVSMSSSPANGDSPLNLE